MKSADRWAVVYLIVIAALLLAVLWPTVTAYQRLGAPEAPARRLSAAGLMEDLPTTATAVAPVPAATPTAGAPTPAPSPTAAPRRFFFGRSRSGS